uniref:Putative salivary lipocalin n=1 Tax=Panstrongylus lignarius TaxID=156445 RepID=A0A224XYM4_9HEMI
MNKCHTTKRGNRIIAVTFLGILTCTIATDTLQDKCLDDSQVEPMTNFQPEKFFNGTWYVTHAWHGTNSTACYKYKAKKEQNGSLSFDYGYYKNGDGGTFIQVRCMETKKTENTKFSFNCLPIQGKESSGFEQYTVDLTFMATDYRDHAIFYTCVPIGNHFAENILILHRTKEDEKMHFEMENFVHRRNANCKENPEF